MTRRQLFTRLSAIALAPLVKWLPNDERHPALDAGVRYFWTPIPFTPGRGIDIDYGVIVQPVPQEGT